MMRTKILMRVGKTEEDSFTEDYFLGETKWFPADVDPKVSAAALVKWYNDGNPPDVAPRLLFDVTTEQVVDDRRPEHDWSKKNLMTLSDHRGVFDNVECQKCGVTARRYGLNHIVRQNPFRAKRFEFCDWKTAE